MDKNGNFKLLVNVAAQLNVETSPGEWKAARIIFFTIVARVKFFTNETDSIDNKNWILWPKIVGITNLVIKKGEEEMTNEQMMV